MEDLDGPPEAEKAYIRCVELDPEHADALYKLERLCELSVVSGVGKAVVRYLNTIRRLRS